MINGEIVPTGEDGTRWIWPTSGELASLAAFSMEKHGLTPAILSVRVPRGGANSSALIAKGVQSLCSMIDTPWFYHSIFDTPDKITLDQIERTFPVNVEILENIDRTPEGYLIYADINTARDVPTTPPTIGVVLFKDTVLVGDPTIAWLDYLHYDRVVHGWPQLPDFAGITWDWGDGTVTLSGTALGGLTATHVYKAPGTYTVTTTLTDLKGVKGTTTNTVTVVVDP